MSGYSRVKKVGSRRFRFNYDRCVLEYVVKPSAEVLADNVEWREKYGHDLWEIENGYVVIDGIGLGRESWKENPEYWCEVYSEELDCEIRNMMI